MTPTNTPDPVDSRQASKEELDEIFQVFEYEDVDSPFIAIQFRSRENRVWIEREEWDNIRAAIEAYCNKRVRASLAHYVLAGMPELTLRQQEYITEVLVALSKEDEESQ